MDLETKLKSLKTTRDSRDWKFFKEVNGEISPIHFDDVDRIFLVSQFGTLTYGKNPLSDYDQWSFHERKGGGSAIIPFVIIETELFIGVVEEFRPLQNENPVLNIPRGAIRSEDHMITAFRIFEEKTGIKSSKMKFVELPGKINPNSSYFETWGEGEGVRFFAVEFQVKDVEQNNDVYVLRENSYPLDKEEGLVFYPYQVVIRLGDMFSRAAVASLLSLPKFEILVKDK